MEGKGRGKGRGMLFSSTFSPSFLLFVENPDGGICKDCTTGGVADCGEFSCCYGYHRTHDRNWQHKERKNCILKTHQTIFPPFCGSTLGITDIHSTPRPFHFCFSFFSRFYGGYSHSIMIPKHMNKRVGEW